MSDMYFYFFEELTKIAEGVPDVAAPAAPTAPSAPTKPTKSFGAKLLKGVGGWRRRRLRARRRGLLLGNMFGKN